MASKSLLFICSLMLMLPAAQAHHSAVLFEAEKQMELSGTVREFQWHNPHCYIQLIVSTEEGEVEWSLEMAAPMYLYNLGWRPSTLKNGDKVTVTFRPMVNGDKGGLILEVLDANGVRIGRSK